jgi:hypothetical protein
MVDTQTLNAMLTSTALVDPAAQAALGLGPDAWPRVAQVELVQAGNMAMKLTVTITPPADAKLPDNPAQKFLDELVARSKKAVEQMANRAEQSTAERRAALEKDLAAARQRWEGISAQLREARSGLENDPERMMGRGSASDRMQLEMNLAAQRARLGVIQAEVDRLRQSPPTTQRAASAPGVSPMGGFVAADPLERWQQEVVSLKANIAESEARLKVLNDRLPKGARAATQPASPQDVDRLQRDENRARQEVDELQMQIDQMRRDRRFGGGGGSPTRLIVLDGRDAQ